jgi:hypothetical protein
MRGPSGAGWSSLAARRAHNPKVAGSNPAPATTYDTAACAPSGRQQHGPVDAHPGDQERAVTGLNLCSAQGYPATEHVEKRVSRLQNRLRVTQAQIASRDPLAQKVGATRQHPQNSRDLLFAVIRRRPHQLFALALQRRNSRLGGCRRQLACLHERSELGHLGVFLDDLRRLSLRCLLSCPSPWSQVLTQTPLHERETFRRQHLLRQFVEQLLLGQRDRNPEPVRARSLPSVLMGRAAVLPAVDASESTAALSASQQPGEQMSGQTAISLQDAAKFRGRRLDFPLPGLDGVPKPLLDDAETFICVLDDSPQGL